MSRAAGKAPDDQAKLKKILDELTKREENKFCADCGCRGPRWASINLGVFICIACSGIHRSLGVHLTFVRSVNLDSWTSEQVVQMQKWGNARAKAYYEANVPHNYRVPNEQSSVREKEMWIRDKYERRRFIAREEPPEESHDRRHGSGSRKKHEEEEEEDDRSSRRTNSSSRSRANESSSSRTSSSSRRAEPAPKAAAPATTNDILSFDVFSSSVAPSSTTAQPAAPAAAPAQDDWASFGGSSGNSQGFTDAFAQPQPAQDKAASNVANIMASFGPAPTPQAPPNPFGAPQGGMMPAPSGVNPMGQGGMMPAPSGMNPMGQGMGMNPMGIAPMGMNPMGMNPMGMNPMGMAQPGFNPMMGQPQAVQPNPMMNPIFGGGAPMGMNPMMGGGMFPGGPAPGMGFPPQQPMGGMGMNPMMGGMNPMGFQQMQPRGPMPQGGMPQGGMPPQQQQQQAGGLNQPFVNLQANGQGGKNPFF